MKKKLFRVVHNSGQNVWYTCGLRYHERGSSDWILGPTFIQDKSQAMKFCKKKAEKIAKILSEQVDEECYSCKHFIEEV